MQSGTDVAREAGDIVLLDNNFASLIKAMETGRVVSDNLKKVCLYLMVGGTWSEMWTVVANVFFAMPTPLGIVRGDRGVDWHGRAECAGAGAGEAPRRPS